MKVTLTVSSKNLSQKQLTFLMNLIMTDSVKAWCRISKDKPEEQAPQEKTTATNI